MSYLRKIQYHILAAVLLAALLFQNPEVLNGNSKVLAWWGTIYPQFCFMEIPEEENMPQKEPKFHFWIAEKVLQIID